MYGKWSDLHRNGPSLPSCFDYLFPVYSAAVAAAIAVFVANTCACNVFRAFTVAVMSGVPPGGVGEACACNSACAVTHALAVAVPLGVGMGVAIGVGGIGTSGNTDESGKMHFTYSDEALTQPF